MAKGIKLTRELKWVAFGGQPHGTIDLRVSLDKHGLCVTSDDVPGLNFLVPVFSESRFTIEEAIKRCLKDNDGIEVHHIGWRMKS